MMEAGTIRSEEVRKIFSDMLRARKVSPAKWSFRKGNLHLLMGSYIATFSIKAGQTWYGVNALKAQLERAIDDLEASSTKSRNQLDIEDAIRAAAL